MRGHEAEHDELKRAAAAFAARTLNDDVARRDREEDVSLPGWKACAEFGLQGMLVAPEYGGAGMDLRAAVATLEGLGYGCRDRGLVSSLNAHLWGCVQTLNDFGSAGQKAELLPGLVDGRWIGANAMTEPESGSDALALRTRARRTDDGYVLDGRKCFVTNAPAAEVFIVYARTGDGPAFSSLSCFAVRAGTPGLSVAPPASKMGLRTSPMSDVFFSECRVPSSARLGAEGSGAMMLMSTMEWERSLVLASAVGGMEYQLEQCAEQVARRVAGNHPLRQRQAVTQKLAEMKLRLEAGRGLLYRAVELKRAGKSAFLESMLAKIALSEAGVANARDTMQIHGGYGYMSEAGLERDLRDALGSTIHSGTTEVLKDAVAMLLLAGSAGLAGRKGGGAA